MLKKGVPVSRKKRIVLEEAEWEEVDEYEYGDDGAGDVSFDADGNGVDSRERYEEGGVGAG